jgi:hypothetical protein
VGAFLTGRRQILIQAERRSRSPQRSPYPRSAPGSAHVAAMSSPARSSPIAPASLLHLHSPPVAGAAAARTAPARTGSPGRGPIATSPPAAEQAHAPRYSPPRQSPPSAAHEADDDQSRAKTLLELAEDAAEYM